MAAAANKPGAVHYALVVFMILSMILGILAYMFHRESSDKFAEVAKLIEENRRLNHENRRLIQFQMALNNPNRSLFCR